MIGIIVGVAFINQEKNLMHILDFNASGLNVPYIFKLFFWNNMFEKKLSKYKDHLDVIFLHHPLGTINVNIACGHIFNHVHNCPNNITSIIDLRSGLTLRAPRVVDKP